MRDFSNDLNDLRRRVDEAAVYLKVAAGKERMVDLEVDVARPDLWDDQDNAKKVNAEYANLKTDLEDFRQLASSVEDLEVLHEMAREVDDETQEPELERGISLAQSKLDALELRSLFTGYMTKPTQSCRSMPKMAVSMRRTGAKCCCVCSHVGPSEKLCD